MFLLIPTAVIVMLTVIVTLLVTLIFVFDKLKTSKLKSEYAMAIAILGIGLVILSVTIFVKEQQLAKAKEQLREPTYWEMVETEMQRRALVEADSAYLETY